MHTIILLHDFKTELVRDSTDSLIKLQLRGLGYTWLCLTRIPTHGRSDPTQTQELEEMWRSWETTRVGLAVRLVAVGHRSTWYNWARATFSRRSRACRSP